MRGAPPFGPERLVTLENWQDPPWNRWSFQHVRELVPSARIARPAVARVLAETPRDALSVAFATADGTTTVGRFLEASQTDGFLVLHGGRIAAEHYWNAMTPETPHLLQSVSKSITATVAGRVVARGMLETDALVSEVVPALAGSSFEGATVRHLLDMRAGTRFDETYEDPASDVQTSDQVYGWRPRTSPDLPEDALAFFGTLVNDGEHGGAFRYRSVLVDVLASVLESACGKRFSELVSAEVWGPMGAEHDAEVTLDAHGNAMADGAISATLRDMGRFGLLYLPDDPVGSAVVPPQWLADTVAGAPDGPRAFREGENVPGFPPGSHYRNCWWVREPPQPMLCALGIFGQYVFVDAATDTVVVKLSSCPKSVDWESVECGVRAARAIGSALCGDQGR